MTKIKRNSVRITNSGSIRNKFFINNLFHIPNCLFLTADQLRWIRSKLMAPRRRNNFSSASFVVFCPKSPRRACHRCSGLRKLFYRCRCSMHARHVIQQRCRHSGDKSISRTRRTHGVRKKNVGMQSRQFIDVVSIHTCQKSRTTKGSRTQR